MHAIASTHIRVRAVHSFSLSQRTSQTYISMSLSFLLSLSGPTDKHSPPDGVLHISFSGIQPIGVSPSASAVRQNSERDWPAVRWHLRWESHAAEHQSFKEPAFSPWAQEQPSHGRAESQFKYVNDFITENICSAWTDPFKWLPCRGALGDNAWRLHSGSAQVVLLLT